MADASYTPKVYKKDGGDTLVIASGGVINVETGGQLQVAGADVTSSVAGAAVAGVAAGYKIARGETALDGSNPTPIATGLTTVVAFVATLKLAVAPGLGTSNLTYGVSGATVNVYGWKPTSISDPTLIASTGTETFGWIAIGT